MQKYLKNNKGFTLVEVIVVAVIVLILAAVAIPLYNGYIQDSRLSSLENAVGSVAAGLGAAVQTGSEAVFTAATDDEAGYVEITNPVSNAVSRIVIPKGMDITADCGTGLVTGNFTRDSWKLDDDVETQFTTAGQSGCTVT